ncbi:S-layer homology domain-containing protein [uncultured Megasphaera sp.]|uniref:S-layer homology domain-containing protein n=1 Tax=uncultured Megasphaera sp. TaxID=165188 RepID=UPI0025D44417|nr:S-layer homology domain-containing protein [uncultured Megasphaera sp.]
MKRRHHCTSSHAKVTLAVLALCGMTAFWGSVAWAADAGQDTAPVQDGIHYFSVKPDNGNRDKNYLNDGAVGTDSLAVGAGAHADGTMGATALGNDAYAEGERALAIGSGSRAIGLDAIAIGTGSKGEANGTNAIAIGEQSHAKGMYTTAVGSYSEATAEGAVALGQQAKSKGAYSTSIGLMANGMYEGGTAADHSTAVGAYSESSGLASVALGGFSKATDKFATALGYGSGAVLQGTAVGAASHITGEGGTAIGRLSRASAPGAVALGMSSVADREAGWQGYHPVYGQMQDISPAWQSTWGAVSVGAGPSHDENNRTIPQRTRQIINLAAGTEDTDAVNVAQLKEAMSDARVSIHAGEGIIVEKLGSEYTIKANLNGLSNIHGEVQILSNPEEFPYDPAQPKVSPDQPGLAPRLQLARSVAEPERDDGGPIHVGYVANEVKFATDDGNTAKLNDGGTVNVLGGDNIHTASSSTTDANGRTVDNIHIKLDKNITVDSVRISRDGPKLDGHGLDMANQSITQLAPGEISETSTDAVNGSQLYATNQMVQENRQNITQLGNSLNKLDNRINRVGAGAAALAALHPLDFDPDDKWDFAAGYGNYRGANAAAVGLYYRPNEDTMFSVGGSFGGGENMINAGVSLKIGRGNHVSNSRVAMAKEIRDLRQALADQAAEIAQLKGMHHLAIDPNKSLLFPDVADNHWAYEYVSKLAGNGILEGYPDGLFKGNQMMTRYEFAAIVYRLMEKGLGHTDPEMNRLAREFSNELSYIRIDTIHQDKDGTPTVQRVRVKK